MNLSLNSHDWGSPLVSLEVIHTMLGITFWLQDVVVALPLGLLMLVRESLVALLGLFWHLLTHWIGIIFDIVFLIWSWTSFFLIWLSRYSSFTSIEELAPQDLIEAKLRSHCDSTILLNLLLYLSLINSFHNRNVLVFFSFMASNNFPAPSSQSYAEHTDAHNKSNEPKDTANDSPFDPVFSSCWDFIFNSLISQRPVLNDCGIDYQSGGVRSGEIGDNRDISYFCWLCCICGIATVILSGRIHNRNNNICGRINCHWLIIIWRCINSRIIN